MKLDRLSKEMVVEVLSHLVRKEDLKRASLVSSSFYTESRPFLFSTLRFICTPSLLRSSINTRFEFLDRQCERFQGLLSQPRLLEYVKGAEWQDIGSETWDPEQYTLGSSIHSKVDTIVPKLFLQTLALCRNLRSLIVRNAVIEDIHEVLRKRLYTICTETDISTLEFHNSKLLLPLHNDYRSPLKTFVASTGDSDSTEFDEYNEGFSLFHPAVIEDLRLDEFSFAVGFIRNDAMLMQNELYTRLTCLSLFLPHSIPGLDLYLQESYETATPDVTFSGDLVKVLSRCVVLEDLSIHTPGETDVPDINFAEALQELGIRPEDFLPKLETFHGRVETTSRLYRVRPVKTVDMMCPAHRWERQTDDLRGFAHVIRHCPPQDLHIYVNSRPNGIVVQSVDTLNQLFTPLDYRIPALVLHIKDHQDTDEKRDITAPDMVHTEDLMEKVTPALQQMYKTFVRCEGVDGFTAANLHESILNLQDMVRNHKNGSAYYYSIEKLLVDIIAQKARFPENVKELTIMFDEGPMMLRLGQDRFMLLELARLATKYFRVNAFRTKLVLEFE